VAVVVNAVEAEDFTASDQALRGFVAAVKLASEHASMISEEMKRPTVRLLKVPVAVYQACRPGLSVGTLPAPVWLGMFENDEE
jgi:hypothetical protein